MLAQLDAGFRSGGMWSEDMVKVASGCREDNPPSWEDILNTAQPNETAEVLEMADLAKRTLQASPYTKLTLGPTFPGSNYVGGADADLIISQRLYEIKTTVKPRERLPVTIRQLIGYILLDWDDNHQIQQAAIYFSRQGETISWNLEELIASTSTKARTDVTQIREEFRDRPFSKQRGGRKQSTRTPGCWVSRRSTIEVVKPRLFQIRISLKEKEPQPTPSKYYQGQRRRRNALKKRRRKAGLCIDCAIPTSNGQARCDKCAVIHKRRLRTIYQEMLDIESSE